MIRSMNTKTRYMLPVFAAVFALMFVVATPYVMAQPDGENHMWKDGAKHHKKHMALKVEGFVGTLQITDDVDKKALKEQVTVSLSEAAQGLDVQMASLGKAVNENDEKFLVWILVSMSTNPETETKTATIHIVDAANADNTAQVTKEFDRSMKDKAYRHDGAMSEKKLAKLEQKLAEPTGDADLDAAHAEFLNKIQELRNAIASGDSEKAQELAKELKELRNQFGNVRNF